jgi:hypothetical protein
MSRLSMVIGFLVIKNIATKAVSGCLFWAQYHCQLLAASWTPPFLHCTKQFMPIDRMQSGSVA